MRFIFYKIMTKEEFLETKKVKNDLINQTNTEIRELEKSFIQEHKEFDIDEKILVSKGEEYERFAFISNIGVNQRGEIYYKAFKCKKDGTPSQHTDYIWSEVLEKI